MAEGCEAQVRQQLGPGSARFHLLPPVGKADCHLLPPRAVPGSTCYRAIEHEIRHHTLECRISSLSENMSPRNSYGSQR